MKKMFVFVLVCTFIISSIVPTYAHGDHRYYHDHNDHNRQQQNNSWIWWLIGATVLISIAAPDAQAQGWSQSSNFPGNGQVPLRQISSNGYVYDGQYGPVPFRCEGSCVRVDGPWGSVGPGGWLTADRFTVWTQQAQPQPGYNPGYQTPSNNPGYVRLNNIFDVSHSSVSDGGQVHAWNGTVYGFTVPSGYWVNSDKGKCNSGQYCTAGSWTLYRN